MKLRSIFTLSLATVAFSCFTVGASAQDATDSAAPSTEATVSQGETAAGKSKDGALKEQLRTVRKAVNQDPAVAEARKASREAGRDYHKAERAAMAEKDPEFAKALEARKGQRPPKGEKGERPKRDKKEGAFKERMEKMKALRDSVKDVPAVKEAAAKRDSAQAAHKAALKAAITKADPSLSAEVVEKMADRMSQRDRKGRHGRHGHKKHHRKHHKGGQQQEGQQQQAPAAETDAASEAPATPEA